MTKAYIKEMPLLNGKRSLFIVYSPPLKKDGKTVRQQALNLSVWEYAQDEEQMEDNTNAYETARAVIRNRLNAIHKDELYNPLEREYANLIAQGEKSFSDYFKKFCAKKGGLYSSCFLYFEAFRADVLFKDMNRIACNGFKDYLQATRSRRSHHVKLSASTAAIYLNCLKSCLNQAFRDGLLKTDVSGQFAGIKFQNKLPVYLTLDELRLLAATPCKSELFKRAALFACLTGLRHSDVIALNWMYYEQVDDIHYISYRQKKTGKYEKSPIPYQAVEYMGEPSTGRIFPLDYSVANNKVLQAWVKAAGIKKHITFHSFRHSYSVLQMAEGTKVEVLSKMLGHSNLKTTMRYAQVLGAAKVETINRIKL